MNENQRITYKLEVTDLNERQGILRVREEGKKAWTKMSVLLSHLLVALIIKSLTDDKARKFDNIEFTSTLTSPEFDENPFKLVRYNNPDGSIKNYKLQMVYEKGFDLVEHYNVFRQIVTKPIYKYWKKSEFLRYYEVNTSS